MRHLTADEYVAGLVGFGMSEPMAHGMRDMALAKQSGIDLAVPRTGENSTPTTFSAWAEEVLMPRIAAARANAG